MIVHKKPNFVKASNLVFISVIVGAINYLTPGSIKSLQELFTAAFTTLLIIVIAILIRQGYNWIKWVILILTITGAIGSIFTLPLVFESNVLAGCLSVSVSILQLLALILMFKPSKSPVINIPA